jgi:hypothetical protein
MADGSVSTLTNPVTGTGTTNTLPKFTAASTIGNSLFTDNGTNGAFGGPNYSAGTGVRTFNITGPQFAGIAFWTGTSQYTADIFAYESTGNLLLNADPSNTLSASNILLNVDDINIAAFNTTNVTLTRGLIGTSATFSSLTAGYITKANSGGLLGNSIIYDSGGSIPKIAINGTTITDGNLLNIQGNQTSVNIGIVLNNTNATYPRIYSIQNVNNSLVFYDYTANAARLTISSTGATTINGASDSVLSLIAPSATAYVAFRNVGGKTWGIGNSFVGTNTNFQIYNLTDNVNALSFTAGGNATFAQDVRALNFSLMNDGFRGGVYTYKGISGGGTDFGITIFAEGGTGNGNIYFCPNGSATRFMSITTSNTVLVNTTSGVTGGGTLQVNGNVNINGLFQINGVTIGGGGGSGVTGSGTAGFITRWTGSTTLANGNIYDDGTNIGINTTSLSGLLTLRATVTNTPSISFQNVSGGPNSAISNFTSAAQTYTVIGTNAYVNNTANIARFSTSYAGCYIAFDEGTMVFGSGTASETPSGRMFLSPAGLLTVNNTIRSSNYGLVRASLFRGGLYTYDAVAGSGTDYGLTLFAEGGSGGGNIYFCPGSSTKVMTIDISGAMYMARVASNLTFADSVGGMYVRQNGSISGLKEELRIFGNSIAFYTHTGSRLVSITDGGNFIIGSSTDNGYKLQVNGSISFAYGFLSIFRGSSSANDIFVGNDGSRIYIGGNTYVAGNVTATGGFFDTSDSRLKIIIKDYQQPKGIENVAARMYLKNGRKELGYFAQDLQEILPSAVSEGTDGFLTLSYSQVHTAKIAVIEDKVTILEREVSELKTKLQKYEA